MSSEGVRPQSMPTLACKWLTNLEPSKEFGMQGSGFYKYVKEYLEQGSQTCTDMIQYICSTDDDMFENYDFNYDGYVENCRRIYGVQPRSIDVPLLEYGGKELSHYSNIIFSNGLLDPWSGLGVLQNISSTVLAYHIPDGAHHVDLRASHDNDTLATRVIRMHHVENIYRWLDEYHREHNVTNFEASQETIN